MTKLFGTDGIRAVAGKYPLDYSSVFTLGGALISLLGEHGFPPQVLIGRDTRESGIWIEKALVRGIQDRGGEAVCVGVIPTSAVAYLTREFSISSGVVISASHNPFQDNGIKVFSSQGMKISAAWEEALEKTIKANSRQIADSDIKIFPTTNLRRYYKDFLKNSFEPESPSRKQKLVLDCSNGASSDFAAQIFHDLGFDAITINASPDGKNINAGCGSLYPEKLVQAVLNSSADFGIAYDGDADRALWVDETGRILNGDHTLFVLTHHMKTKQRLRSKTVVATIMSNLGLEVALSGMGLNLHRAQVGDKYVLEHMLKLNSNLGGEQSGHTILLDSCPTGDGMLTSIKMLEAMVSRGAKLSELVADYQEFPQVLKNVPVTEKQEFSLIPEIAETIARVEADLGSTGRLNVRYSGTELLARVMVEGRDLDQIEEYARSIVEVLAKHLRRET